MVAQEKIHNIFFDVLTLLWGVVIHTITATIYFIVGKKPHLGQRVKIFKLMDFFVIKWPKNFYARPSLYKLTRFIGDMIHYMFLKK